MSQPQQPPTFHLPEDKIVGVFADSANLSASAHAFTVDFLRSSPYAAPPGEMILASRVAMSPILAQQLRDLLDNALQQWTQAQMGGGGNEP